MAASLARALRATGGWKVLREWRPRALTASTPHLVFCPRTLWSSTVRRSSADKEEQPPSSAGAESPKEPQEQSRPPPRYTDQGGEESEDYESEEALQHRILTAALQYVPEYGWSAEAIAAGAQSLDLSSAAAGMFEGGGSELVLHFVSECNARLSELMEEEHKLVQLGSAEKKPVARFLEDVLQARLRMQIPYIGQWPQALGLLLFPQNIPSSLKLLTAMVDDIWHYAGDQSTDVSWYTRRAVLAGIYKTTELVMLQDSSPEFEDTWTFLHNRISEATAMGTSVKQVTSTGEAVVQGLLGAAVTLKNLTGLNQRR